MKGTVAKDHFVCDATDVVRELLLALFIKVGGWKDEILDSIVQGVYVYDENQAPKSKRVYERNPILMTLRRRRLRHFQESVFGEGRCCCLKPQRCSSSTQPHQTSDQELQSSGTLSEVSVESLSGLAVSQCRRHRKGNLAG
jgi:hypothetical protein